MTTEADPADRPAVVLRRAPFSDDPGLEGEVASLTADLGIEGPDWRPQPA